MIATRMPVGWQRDVPGPLVALDTLPRRDYVDVFTATLPAPPSQPIEAWFRDVLRDAPFRVRLVLGFAVWVQRHVLGLQLAAEPAADRLLGWRIDGRGESWLRLEARAHFGTGHLLLHLDGRCLSCATFLQYRSRLGPLIWAPVSLLHGQVGLALMRHAVRASR